MKNNNKIRCNKCGQHGYVITDHPDSNIWKPTITCTGCNVGFQYGYDAEPYASNKFVIDKRTKKTTCSPIQKEE